MYPILQSHIADLEALLQRFPVLLRLVGVDQ